MSLPEEIAQKVHSLPTLSSVAMRLVQIVNDEKHNVADMVRVISSDAILTSKLLRLANSAYFARGGEVTSVQRAVTMLGDRLVMGIVLGISNSEVYAKKLDGYAAESALWKHSIRTAIAAREMATVAKDKISPDEAFTAGLLHDIGKAVISEFLKGSTDKILYKLDNKVEDEFLGAEQALLGTTHPEVGFALANRWGLPESLSEAIRFHHAPDDAEEKYRTLVYTTHLGDLLSMIGGTDTGIDAFAYRVNPNYINYFTLTIKDVDRILLNIQTEFDAVKDVIGLTEDED